MFILISLWLLHLSWFNDSSVSFFVFVKLSVFTFRLTLNTFGLHSSIFLEEKYYLKNVCVVVLVLVNRSKAGQCFIVTDLVAMKVIGYFMVFIKRWESFHLLRLTHQTLWTPRDGPSWNQELKTASGSVTWVTVIQKREPSSDVSKAHWIQDTEKPGFKPRHLTWVVSIPSGGLTQYAICLLQIDMLKCTLSQSKVILTWKYLILIILHFFT